MSFHRVVLAWWREFCYGAFWRAASDPSRATPLHQNHAPEAENCADPKTPIFTLPQETSLDLSTSNQQSPAELKTGLRQICVSEWDFVFDFVLGRLQTERIETGPPRRVCGVCRDAEGQPIPGTAMIFDIAEPAD